MLVHSHTRGRVEHVRDGDDLGKDRQLARTERLGVAFEVDSHVMLVGRDHTPIGDGTVPSETEQRYRALRWVELHGKPLLSREPVRLVQHLDGDAGLSNIVEKRSHAEVVAL